ncbi:TRAP transporter small permease subunit [Aeromicrobium sp. YIM 150415]|uniref:TRAP transporter small permease n=1 Tax=Aeromicrobium sp. YIM 150415 TaxID=2803912 RepID=UPI001962B77F|nr:TRAP transporter small permease subunit [Aeromicrobium sp. YIM 150415]MBM9464090.1 TRAP transporter small permease subunit [Aeromicrobium sp. YIM 150415]
MTMTEPAIAAPPPETRSRVTSLVTVVSRAAQYLCGGAILLMMLTVAADVVMRQLGSSLPFGTTPVITYLFMPLVCSLGLAMAQLTGEHVRVGLLIEHAGPKVARIVESLADLIVGGLMLWIGVLGLQAVGEAREKGEHAGLEQWLVLWPIKLVVTAGILLFMLAAFTTILERLLGRGRHISTQESADGTD